MKFAWHCLRVYPGWDFRIAVDLNSQGYLVHVPVTFVKLRHGREVSPVPELKVRGYLFVRRWIEAPGGEQSLRPALETNGVIEYLPAMLDGIRNPAVVPERVIDGMRKDEMEDCDFASRRVRKDALFRVGDVVTVAANHPLFAGRECRVTEARSGSVWAEYGDWKMRFDEAELMPADCVMRRTG